METLSLREAQAFPLDPEVVRSCLLDSPTDRLFAQAFEHGLHTLAPAERRGALAGVTGHVAESVTEVLLDELGYHVVWHFEGPGRHGIDLLELLPTTDRLLAVEVKGTLRPGRWPRLSNRELRQMSAAWVDKGDNPGMAEWGLTSEDVEGAVVLVNFADRRWKAGLTTDFVTTRPVRDLADLGG
jgi:hypothetical protein